MYKNRLRKDKEEIGLELPKVLKYNGVEAILLVSDRCEHIVMKAFIVDSKQERILEQDVIIPRNLKSISI